MPNITSTKASAFVSIFGEPSGSGGFRCTEFDFFAPLVVGKSGTGHDVTFQSATEGYYFQWDESVSTLFLRGLMDVGASGAGHDVTFHGDTASNYMRWDASEDSLLLVGPAVNFSLGSFTGSTSGTGAALSNANTKAFMVYADDGGAGMSQFARAGVFRHLLTYTDGNREQEATGVIGQIVSVAGTNRHNKAGVFGSYEARTSLVVDGTAVATDTWMNAGVIGRVGGAQITINSNGVLAGVAAMSNVATALASNSGIYAGLYVGKWGNAAATETWTHGLYIASTAVDQAIQVGELASDDQTGLTLSSTNYEAVSIYTDDGNTTLTGGDPFVGIHSRTMFFKDQAGGTTAIGLFGQQKYASGVDIGPARVSAVEGYQELMTTNKVPSGGIMDGVRAEIDCVAGVITVENGGILAGFHANLTGAGQLTQDTGGIAAGLYIAEAVTTGQWGYGIYMTKGAAGRAMQVGALSSGSQLGMTLSSTNYEAISIYTDDGNASLTGGNPFVGIHSRTMFFKDQAGSTTAIGLFGQLKYASGVDIGPARTAAVEAYNELMTTNTVPSGGTVAGLSSQTEISAGTLTVESGGELFGIHARLTGGGEAVQDSTGILAGLYVDETVTTGQWGYGAYVTGADIGLYVNAACTEGFRMGEFSSATHGSGIDMGSTTAAARFYMDDNNVALTGDRKGVWIRNLIVANHTGALTTRALLAQTKVKDDIDFDGDQLWAIEGYLELPGTTDIDANGAGAIRARMDIDDNITVQAGFLAGVLSTLGTTSGVTITQTAPLAAFVATLGSDAADSWGSALCIDGADNVLRAQTGGGSYADGIKIGSMTNVGGGDGNTADGLARVDVAGTPYYIALYAAGNVTGE